MTRAPLASVLALAALLAACTGGSPTAGGGSTKPAGTAAKPSGSKAPGASTAPGASGAPGASPGAGGASPSGAVANPGPYVWKPGAARYVHRNKSEAGTQTTYVTLTIDKIEGGKAGFKVTSQQAATGPSAERAFGSFDVATGNPYWGFVDINLKNDDVLAAAAAEGEETLTVPAGTYACTKTRYRKTTSPGADVDVTLWVNGRDGLVAAQVSNKLAIGAISQTSDIRLELETAP